jgi:hypothetical protein
MEIPMLTSILGVRVFQDAPPLEVAIVLVIAAIFVWVLWIGARSGKNPQPTRPERPGEGDSLSA